MNTTIVGIIGGAVLLVLLITLLITAKFTKNATVKKFADKMMQVFSAVFLKMVDTEPLENLTSEEKKSVCLMKINEYCSKNGIDTSQFDIDAIVEFFIQISYNLNSDEDHKAKAKELE